ncbi:hypothetical protein [Pseudoduganella lutea]|uniref:ImmA/IrrE family metallo-endopeptidase n=1 Tax=Pseudoduganella lutea TaxID=321985 RepID=A0A4P6L4N0_9BURK|nr:hypothetical protein [Pseudoduganella lutea]QBE65772.1 hypothetical protein EWM63_24640 [Pseudoduganella lutea]
MKKFLFFISTLFAPLCALGFNTCPKIDKIPKDLELFKADDFIVPKTAIGSAKKEIKIDAKNIAVIVEAKHKTSIFTVLSSYTGKFPYLCNDIGGLTDGQSAIFEFPYNSKPIFITLISPPGSSFNIKYFTSGKEWTPTSENIIPRLVHLPVNVMIFDEAPLAFNAIEHIQAAEKIWLSAGIKLVMNIRKFNSLETENILGKKKTIETHLGCVQRFDEPGYAQRKKLMTLKKTPETIGIFFAKNLTQSQAEKEFNQVYMSKTLGSKDIGRTLAHEIGHLLLGEGHPNGKAPARPCTIPEIIEKVSVKWTSGLMEPGDISNSTSISEDDSKIARLAARKLPGATWW